MNMTKNLTRIALITVLLSANAGAATLSLSPNSLSVAQGSTFFIDLVIAGLTNGGPESLGDFEVDISYNPFALELISYTFDTHLGDIGAGEALDASFGEVTPGELNLAVVSFLPDAQLHNQPDTFVLATLAFTAISLPQGASTSIVFNGIPVIGDELGDPITLDFVQDSLVFGAAPIPLPATLWLFAGALTFLTLTRARH